MLDKQKLAYKTARLLGGGIGQKRAAAALCALLAVGRRRHFAGLAQARGCAGS